MFISNEAVQAFIADGLEASQDLGKDMPWLLLCCDGVSMSKDRWSHLDFGVLVTCAAVDCLGNRVQELCDN
jgi:hypothetical protein